MDSRTAKTTRDNDNKESGFGGLISAKQLERLAGGRSYERGLAYFRRGAVERLLYRDGRISARVVGTDLYTAKFWLERRKLKWRCTCPIGDDGEFCKHLVAAGLAWLDGAHEDAAQGASELDAIGAWLEASDKRTLVKLLLERAEDDDELAAQLLVAAQRAGPVNPKALRDTIRKNLSAGGFIDYQDMPAFAARATLVPDMLDALLRRGDAKAAAELAADAAHRCLKILLHADDSDGRLGAITEAIADVHLQAARKGGLAPAALAGELFNLQLADGFDFFNLERYLPILGKTGLAAYRKLAEQAWEKVPARAPGADAEDDESDEDDRRYQLAGIMKTLARHDGDVDALVDVLRRDCSRSWTYLEIAQALAKAGRHDEALRWAEDGRKAFPNEWHMPLEDFLVAEYHRHKRHGDAVALRWTQFTKHPGLAAYQALKAAATKARKWPSWREKALATLRPHVKKIVVRHKPRAWAPADSKEAVLVEIHLWEGDAQAALAAARGTSLPVHLWTRLGNALEAGSPDEAITIYQDQIEPIVGLTNNQAYDDAAELVRRVRDLMARVGKAADFGDWLVAVRAQHKAKRNFMQRLDRIAESDLPGKNRAVKRGKDKKRQ